MTSIRVSKEFLDRLKDEQDAEESHEDTLRYLLGWEEDVDDDAEDSDEEE